VFEDRPAHVFVRWPIVPWTRDEIRPAQGVPGSAIVTARHEFVASSALTRSVTVSGVSVMRLTLALTGLGEQREPRSGAARCSATHCGHLSGPSSARTNHIVSSSLRRYPW
jgi:hypothetical protein